MNFPSAAARRWLFGEHICIIYGIILILTTIARTILMVVVVVVVVD